MSHPETLLVLYLGSNDAVDAVCARLPDRRVEPANPYWRRNSTVLADPDGFQVVLVSDTWAADRAHAPDPAE